MVAPGTWHHRSLQASSCCCCCRWSGTTMGHIGATLAVSRRRRKLKVSAGWSQAQVPSQVLPIDMASYPLSSRNCCACLALGRRDADAGTGTGSGAQAICSGAWLQFGHGHGTGSRSCAISNWNLSFMWPEARVFSAARGHCLARTSTRTRNRLHLSLNVRICPGSLPCQQKY